MINFFHSKSPESMTRLVFFMFAIMVMFWQTWAVVTKTTVPNLIEILGFMALSMGWKQWTEKSNGSSTDSNKQNT